jgi:hypothetical protein
MNRLKKSRKIECGKNIIFILTDGEQIMNEIKLVPTQYYNDGHLSPIKKSTIYASRNEKLKAYAVEVDGREIGVIREHEETKYGDAISYRHYWQPLTPKRCRIKGLDCDGSRQGAVDALINAYGLNHKKSA